MFNIKIINTPIIKYNPMLVIDTDKLPNIGATKLIKLLTSNWSRGLNVFTNKFSMVDIYYILDMYTHVCSLKSFLLNIKLIYYRPTVLYSIYIYIYKVTLAYPLIYRNLKGQGNRFKTKIKRKGTDTGNLKS